VAQERRQPLQVIEELIDRLAEEPLPLPGQERIVNVLELNRALDGLSAH
jgi:K+-transporting ATPase c subunit